MILYQNFPRGALHGKHKDSLTLPWQWKLLNIACSLQSFAVVEEHCWYTNRQRNYIKCVLLKKKKKTLQEWDVQTEIKKIWQKEEGKVQEWQMKSAAQIAEVSMTNRRGKKERVWIGGRKGAEGEKTTRKGGGRKFHHCCDNVGGKQHVGRFMGEKNAERTGSWLFSSDSSRISSSTKMANEHQTVPFSYLLLPAHSHKLLVDNEGCSH